MAFDASELLLRFEQSCGGPAGATDFLRANVLRFAPPVGPLTSTSRSTPPRSAFDRSITTRYRRFRSSPRSTRSSNSGLPAFALVVVPAGFSAHPIPHNPAAFPQRTQPAVGFGRCGGPTRRVTSFPGWLLGFVARLARSALRLHLRLHLGDRQRHPQHQLLPADNLELVIGLALIPLVFVSHGSSLLSKSDSQRELDPSSGESRCFLFSTFNSMWGILFLVEPCC
jgi:hypothetical protein